MLLERMGLRTVGDVLYDFPFRYRDRTRPAELFFSVPEGEVLFRAKVVRKYVSRKALFLEVTSELAKIKITYFHSPFLSGQFLVGREYYFYGMIRDGSMANPEFSGVEDESFLRIIPVYRLTENLSQSTAGKIHSVAVEMLKNEGIPENLPEEILEEEQLLSRGDALEELHLPTSFERIEKAKERMAFEELFCIFFDILQKRRRDKVPPFTDLSRYLSNDMFRSVPFALTNGQKKAISDIKRDLESGYLMNRLVNGDVGSGKSVVAYAAAGMVASAGSQVLIMAPTTILAEQLYRGYGKIFGEDGTALLTSQLSRSEREKLYRDVKTGAVKIVFGTHAVLSEELEFFRLDLVITDEQQRFGTLQRKKALEKSRIPHNLYLTATPIPQTLAMTFFANMDVSRIEEKPSGRIPVTTRFIGKKDERKMLAFIQSRIDAGEQAYVVTPVISGERGSVEAAVRILRKSLNARIASVHGEMESKQVERILGKFKEKELDVLVSTTMIEVGVDNPNATIMVIIDCERFGLSQLHQLRGRVGRGSARSHCFLCSKNGMTERIEAILNCDNGFDIAERDLAIRGPGDFVGSRQSGAFQISLSFDENLLRRAYAAAEKYLRKNITVSNKCNLC